MGSIAMNVDSAVITVLLGRVLPRLNSTAREECSPDESTAITSHQVGGHQLLFVLERE